MRAVIRFAVGQHGYWLGIGVGMMLANPTPKYLAAGAAWAAIGFVLGCIAPENHND